MAFSGNTGGGFGSASLNDEGFNDGGFDAAGPSTDDACRNCGQIGHYSRECPEPRVFNGACFNCGQEGKAECPEPRVFSGACFNCGQEGHNKANCPTKPAETCRNCGKEGHQAVECKDARVLDLSGIAVKNAEDAWKAVLKADGERDLEEIREAVKVYVKAEPTTTYVELEKAFRVNYMNTYLIACDKEVTDTFTLMDLQGNLDREYCVGFYFDNTPQRSRMRSVWPSTPRENFRRLANGGIQVDRKIPKCSNCDKLGHIAKSCPTDRVERDRVEVKCVNCDQIGHRVRDCPEPRKDRFACRNCGDSGHKASDCPNPRSADNVECHNCGQKGHFVRDCPTKEKETCHNCGEEGHRSKECMNPKKTELMRCRNCDKMGHISKDCPDPRDYSRIKCNTCGEMGHTTARCKVVPHHVDNNASFDVGSGGFDTGNEGFDSGDKDFNSRNAGSGSAKEGMTSGTLPDDNIW